MRIEGMTCSVQAGVALRAKILLAFRGMAYARHQGINVTYGGLAMSHINFPLAPNMLSQSILPNWGFSLFTVNLGASSRPEVEYEVLQNVGSYGKQIGHLAEALEVVIKQLHLLDQDLPQKDRDALQIFLGDIAKVRHIKSR